MNLQIVLVFLIGIISALNANDYNENYDDPITKTKGMSKIFFLDKTMLSNLSE